MWASIGFRKTQKTVVNFPALILTPAFSYWVFGPVEAFSCQTWCRGGNSRLGLSFLHSWINFIITVSGQLVFVILKDPREALINFLVTSFPFHVFGAIFLILLQFLQKCNCCTCCTTGCCESITQQTLLDVDNPLEKIEGKQTNNEEHEMEIQV